MRVVIHNHFQTCDGFVEAKHPRGQGGKFSGSGGGWGQSLRNLGRKATGKWGVGPGYVVAYHGTNPENMAKINKEGLRADLPHRFSKEYYQGERGKSVYLTGLKSVARGWAKEHRRGLAAMLPAKRGAVAEIHIPVNDPRLRQPNLGAGTYLTGKSSRFDPNHETYQALYRGTIPPEWITSWSGRTAPDSLGRQVAW